jgi:hypothetical protein
MENKRRKRKEKENVKQSYSIISTPVLLKGHHSTK